MKRSFLILSLAGLFAVLCVTSASSQSIRWSRPHFFDPATAIRFTPDGTKAVIGTQDSTIQIYDMTRGEMEAQISVRDFGAPSALAILSDGRVVFGTNNGTLGLYNPSSNEIFKTAQLNDKIGSIEARTTYIAASSAYGEARLWTTNFDSIFGDNGTSNPNNHVAFSSDLRYFAYSFGPFARILDLKTGDYSRQTDTIRSPSDLFPAVLDLSFSPDVSALYFTREGDGIYRYELATGAKTKLFSYNFNANHTVFNTRGNRVTYQTPAGIGIYDCELRQQVGDWPLTSHPFAWAIDAVGNSLLVSTRDGLDLVAIGQGLISSLWGMNYPITGVVATPDGSQLVSIDSRHGAMAGWETETGRRLWTRIDPLMVDQTHPILSSDPNMFLHARMDGTVGLFNIKDGQRVTTIGRPGAPHSATAMCRSGDTVFLFLSDNTVEAWEISTGSQAGSGPISMLPGLAAVSPDGTRLAIAGKDHIAILDRSTFRELQYFQSVPSYPLSIEFSPDGRELFVGTTLATRRYQVTNVATYQTVPVAGFSLFLPDRSGFVSMAPDSTVQRYSLQTGAIMEKQHALLAQTGAYTYIPGKAYLAVGSILGDLQLLKINGVSSVRANAEIAQASIRQRGSEVDVVGLPAGTAELRMMDMTGRTVISRQMITSGELALDLHDIGLPSGVYVVTVQAAGTSGMARVSVVQ